jgi:hypothetical protein
MNVIDINCCFVIYTYPTRNCVNTIHYILSYGSIPQKEG